VLNQIGDFTLIALTATATPKVQLDIQRNLQMEDADVFKSSFNRENLYYEVRPKKQAKKQVIKYIKDNKGKSGIIYCLSRKKVEEIAELLQVNDIKAAPYHAGLDSHVRMRNQDAFLNEEVDVIVATIAFGMGIDKPDVRFVIHYNCPKSLEGYYQETGRAGRDGLEGNCLMFYSYNDILKLEKFNKDKPVTERDNSKILLGEISAYSESAVCRRKQLLHYFGEHYDENRCGGNMSCDNCRFPKDKFDGQEQVVLALQAAQQTEQRFGLKHLADVIRGIRNQYVTSYQHDKLEIFGKGSHEDEDFWSSILRQTLLNEFLEKDIEAVGVLKITEKGFQFLKKPYPVTFSKDHEYHKFMNQPEEIESIPIKSYDQTLFELLKGVRKKVAREKSLPPYVIFQDPSLEEMATVYPLTIEELSQINGVGRGKVQKFGKPFLEVINKYVEDNNIETASEVVVKTAVNRSMIKIYIIQQIDRKINLDEIAESKGISFGELLEEMEHICYSGTKINIDYYIDDMIDDERQEEVYDYFRQAEDDSITLALEELGEEDYSEEELRLMRIKFISEYAN
jgi:ATP-dependent DNA helicase RecQ